MLARVDAKLLQIMPKLQILLEKGYVTFNNNNNDDDDDDDDDNDDDDNNNNNNNNKRKRFQLSNFPRAAILDVMTSLRCFYCWKTEVLLFELIGQSSVVMKSKMAARGKFKSRNLFRLLLLLLSSSSSSSLSSSSSSLLLLLNVTYPFSSKICNVGIICSNIASTRANNRGSL